MSNISIIGSGSWGCALGIHLAKMGHNIKMWSYSQEEAELINNDKKCKYLSDVNLPPNIDCYIDYKSAIENTEILLLVTPSKVIRETIQKCKKYITNQIILICSKGFEEKTLYTLNKVVEEELPNSRIGGLSRTESCRRSCIRNTNSISNSF